MSQSQGDYISGTVTGNVSGQAAIGKDISQNQTVGAPAQLTDDERAELQQLFVDLRARVAAEAPGDHRDAAVERVQELEEALSAADPDLTTAEYVKRWFLKRLPGLAGLVTGVLVNPIVGKLVQLAGDTAVDGLARIADE